MNITPQMPKLLPVGFNIQSVITLEKDILQVVYVYKSGGIHVIIKLEAHILYIVHLS